MSSPNLFRTCPDGHRCENNALCVEAAYDEGSYYCDCSTASGDYAGLSCEFEADVYCRAPQETTASWFCANQGTCVRGGSQWKCDCLPEYDGSRCEYIAGAKPNDWPGNNAITEGIQRSNSGEDGVETGVMIAIVVVSALVGLMLAFLVLRSIRRRTGSGEQVDDDLKDGPSFRKTGQNAPKDQSEALNIDMDGTGFRDAVVSSKSNTTERFDFDSHPDSEMGTPRATMAAPDPFGAPQMNGNSNRSSGGSSRRNNGHGMML